MSEFILPAVFIGAIVLAICLICFSKKKPDETIPLDFLGESKTNTETGEPHDYV